MHFYVLEFKKCFKFKQVRLGPHQGFSHRITEGLVAGKKKSKTFSRHTPRLKVRQSCSAVVVHFISQQTALNIHSKVMLQIGKESIFQFVFCSIITGFSDMCEKAETVGR